MSYYSSNARYQNGSPSSRSSGSELTFDVVAWFPHYQTCVRHFLDMSQHLYSCQALAAFLNIMLPSQRFPYPVQSGASSVSATPRGPPSLTPSPVASQSSGPPPNWVSLILYIRRLVVTGFDSPAILREWFGDNWRQGVGPLHEQEKRNLLFAAKSGGWASVKKDYDMYPDQMVPFLKPLEDLDEDKIQSAELAWSNWLAMEDWMVGPRRPE